MATLTVKYDGATREPLFNESSWEFVLNGESQGSFTWTATSGTDIVTDKTVQVLEGATVVFEGRTTKVVREDRGSTSSTYYCVAEVRGLEWYLDNHTPLITRGFPARNNREIIQAVISDAGDPGAITALDADIDIISGDGEDILVAYKDATVREILDDLALRTNGSWWRVDHADKGLHFFATPGSNDATFDVDDSPGAGEEDVRNLVVKNNSQKPLDRVIVHGETNGEGVVIEGASGTATNYTRRFTFPWVLDSTQATAYAKSLLALRGDRREFTYQIDVDDLVVGQLQDITDSNYGVTAEDALIHRISVGMETKTTQLYTVDAGDPRPTVEQFARRLEAVNDRNQDLLDIVTGVEFDGANDFINDTDAAYQDLLGASGQFSISAWIVVNSLDAEMLIAHNDFIDSGGGPKGDTDGWAITITTAGKIRCRTAQSVTDKDMSTTNQVFTIGKLHHFVVYVTPATQKAYIDGGSGEGFTGTGGTGTVDPDSTTIDIGGAGSGGGDPLDGWLSRIVMTSDEASQSEAAAMYSQGLAGDNSTGLDAVLFYIECDDGSDGDTVGTLDDTGGSNRDWAGQNAATFKDRSQPKNI